MSALKEIAIEDLSELLTNLHEIAIDYVVYMRRIDEDEEDEEEFKSLNRFHIDLPMDKKGQITLFLDAMGELDWP